MYIEWRGHDEVSMTVYSTCIQLTEVPIHRQSEHKLKVAKIMRWLCYIEHVALGNLLRDSMLRFFHAFNVH